MDPRPSPARFVVAVGSGKGGVGKSTVALNVALALRERGDAVGLLDLDVYGPNTPVLMNIARTIPAHHWTLWRKGEQPIAPVEHLGLKVMSSGFIMAESQAMSWGSDLVGVLLGQFVHQVEWGALDYLVVDLPPGTADVMQKLVGLVPLAGVVVVVTPQDVAHLDARRAVEAYRNAGVRILGGVENMGPLECPHCHQGVEVFHPVSDARSVWSLDVARLGSIPLDPDLSRSGDSGRPLLVDRPASAQADAFRSVAWRIASAVGD